MVRLRTRAVASCVLALLACSCVTRTSFHQNGSMGKSAYAPVKDSEFSSYIRGIFRISSENNERESQERAALLAEAPDMAGVLARAEQSPPDMQAQSQAVEAYMQRQFYWAAYGLLSKTWPGQATDAGVNLNLAAVWDAWGNYELALHYGDIAIAHGASSAAAFELLGRIHLHRNDTAAAIAMYTRSLQEAATAPVFANLGYAHMLRGEWQEARASLEQAVELDGTIPEARNNLAVALSKTGGSEAETLEHLMENGSPAAALNNMGVLYWQEKKTGQAENYFQQALRAEPEYALARRNLESLQAMTPPPSIIHLPSFHPAVVETAEIPAVEITPVGFDGVAPPPVIVTEEPAAAVVIETATETQPRKAAPRISAVRHAEPAEASPTTASISYRALLLEYHGMDLAGFAGLLLLTGALALRPRRSERNSITGITK